MVTVQGSHPHPSQLSPKLSRSEAQRQSLMWRKSRKRLVGRRAPSLRSLAVSSPEEQSRTHLVRVRVKVRVQSWTHLVRIRLRVPEEQSRAGHTMRVSGLGRRGPSLERSH